jgi:hypothetical protein
MRDWRTSLYIYIYTLYKKNMRSVVTEMSSSAYDIPPSSKLSGGCGCGADFGGETALPYEWTLLGSALSVLAW